MLAPVSIEKLDKQSRVALVHLAQVALTLGACVALTYLLPGLARFRPWLSEEPLPIIDRFTAQEAGMPAPDAATGFVAAVVDPEPVRQAPSTAELGGGMAAPRRDALPATPVSLQLPRHGAGLRPFFARLAALPVDGGLVRVAHYGDSSIATDQITMTLRRELQARFGDGGHGFTLIAKGTMPYRHHSVRASSNRRWALAELVRSELGEAGAYGFGGVRFSIARFGASATFATRSEGELGRRFATAQLYYEAFPRGGRLSLRVDDQAEQQLETGSETTEARVHTLRMPEGPHRVVLRHLGGGNLRLFGMAFETEGPGIVYDSLGLVGARARRLLNYEPAHIAEQLALRGTALVVLGFGGNEASDALQRVERYQADYQSVIRRMRGPEGTLPCIVFAPLDQAARNARGRIVTMPNVPRIVEAQSRAAAAEGCAFFNTFEAMGGEGAMRRWYGKRPRLAFGDFRHATPAGYALLARYFTAALLEAYADYLTQSDEAPGVSSSPEPANKAS